MLVERERNRADRADVLGDIVAALAVAAGGREDELAAFVAEIDGDAVDFRIGDVAAGDREAGFVGVGQRRIVFFAKSRRFSSAALPLPLIGVDFLGDRQQLGVGGFESAGGPFAQVGRIVRVVDREHRPRMGDRAEAFDRLAADALRGAVRRDEIRVRCFKFAQFREQLVVLAVRDRRRGVDVVATIVLANLVAKVGNSLFDGLGH